MQPNWSVPMHAYNLSTCKTQAHTQLLFYGDHVNLTQMDMLFYYDLINGKHMLNQNITVFKIRTLKCVVMYVKMTHLGVLY